MPQDSTASALPLSVVDLLQTLCTRLALTNSVIEHGPTFSAAETQAVLPPGCLVQKTVTDRVADKLVVWTGAGDFRLSHRAYRSANRTLGLRTRSEHTLNPHDVDALKFYGMQPGMVSPFFIPGTQAISQIAAIFLVDQVEPAEGLLVALSLSLHKSLLIPLKGLDELVHLYASTVYADVPLYRTEVLL